MRGKLVSVLLCVILGLLTPYYVQADEDTIALARDHFHKEITKKALTIPEQLVRFIYDSGYSFDYPEDGVRGVYVTGNSAGGQRFETLLELLNSTELNAMVIDIKDDHGYLTYRPEKDSPYYGISKNFIGDTTELMKTLEANEIYPIARVVVFKDTELANKRPELSFTENGKVWKNGRGESFVNPFLKEVWDYNIEIAKMAAEMGFKEIQFDYVRFPEGFERRDDTLSYDTGEYSGQENNVQKRVAAVTDFVAYAKEQLSSYDVDVSVDIFGYSATITEAPGIGQNFSKIASNVDVISSMIYPSHWTPYFGLDKPDLYPYELTKAYAKVENQVLQQLENRPTSRPWIQDFTASWLGSGNYLEYGVKEVEAQIRALNEENIHEFLLWNATNRYTPGVNYKP
ncbi:putative glycoside hydrolase [Bacillus suaedae]|uniref:Glycoside hydrolase n=1 Tax=Halalkalibacter suaedae TaxID=2822140 RepID=A0A940WSB4_9BACI|nr:putative glycoside hydrolase [Bacillus suaedae]MBP3949522.1 putative glycoside hydrolase [Bacillus suaedae]